MAMLLFRASPASSGVRLVRSALRFASAHPKPWTSEAEAAFEHGFEEEDARPQPAVSSVQVSVTRDASVGAGHPLLGDTRRGEHIEYTKPKSLAASSTAALTRVEELTGSVVPGAKQQGSQAEAAQLVTGETPTAAIAIQRTSPVAAGANGISPSWASTHLQREGRKAVAASRQADALMSDPSLLGMHPDRLSVQQDLTSARSAGRVLALCTKEEVAAMDGVNLATALHRFAKLVGPADKLALSSDRFTSVLEALPAHLPQMRPQGLVNILWALVRLDLSPAWLDDVLSLCLEHHRSFSTKDLSATLSCLAKAPALHASPLAESLRGAVVQAVHARIAEFTQPMDLVCTAAALSRLELRNEQIFARIAEQTVVTLEAFDMSDIASITWAFANLNFTHREMFTQIRKVLEQQIEQCTARELVQISWAFSKVKRADKELLSDVFAPVIRAKMLEFDVPRDLCTLAWTFSNAKVSDAELFNDLAHILSAKVKLMNAHDVSSIVVAFSSIEYAHQRLFRALQKHTKNIIHSFSPLQLARAIYGFGTSGVDDEILFKLLCEQAIKKQHLLHAKNIVEIIIGLSEAEYTPTRVIHALVGDASHLVRWIAAEDAIQLLHAMSRIPSEKFDTINLHAATDRLLSVVRQRVQGWWRFQAQDMADLLEASMVLGCIDAFLLKRMCQQLPRVLRGLSRDSNLFMRLWGALSELPAESLLIVREHLHRGKELQDMVEERLVDTVSNFDADIRTAALLIYACSRLGYDGPAVCTLLEEVCLAFQEQGQPMPEPWWPYFIWSLAEMDREQDLARMCVELMLHDRYASASPQDISTEQPVIQGPHIEDETSIGALIRLAWACSVLDVALPGPLLDEICQRSGEHEMKDADFLHRAQVVALQYDYDQSGETFAAPPPQIATVKWLEGLLHVPAAGLSGTRPQGQSQQRVTMSALWLSRALVKLKVPHEAPILVGSVHHVPVAFPQERLVLDVLGAGDLNVPSQRVAGSAILRHRQLESLGWRCDTLRMHVVQKAEKEGATDQLLIPLLQASKMVSVPASTPGMQHNNEKQ